MALYSPKSPSQAPSLTGNVITICAGDGDKQVTIYAHEDVLRNHSKFFDAAIAKPWKEAAEKRINLSDDNPESVQLYLQYLYTGIIYYRHTTSGEGLADDYNLPEYLVLARLYVFCEKMQDCKAKNAVIDAIAHRMLTELDDGRTYFPITEAVDIIYRGTMPGSPARRLLVDTHAQTGNPSWLAPKPEGNNVDFMLDLAKAQYAARPATLGKLPHQKHIEKAMYYEKAQE